ncbi:MAG: HD domain-containing phosphohydrolase [Bdellovibrionota bacterium]
MQRILVVEDDDFFRDAVCDALKKKFTVLSAPNGKAAKDIMTLQDFDLVVSDIQMPNLTGIELLEWAKTNKPDTPFIIMTGFSMLLETKSAFDLGAKGFIAKPFKNVELISTIYDILGLNKLESVETKAKEEYCKVSIEEFVSRPIVDFDVYVKLSEVKVIKIAHKGYELPKDKVLHYKGLGVKFLYIKKEDFHTLIEFNLQVARAVNAANVSQEKKNNFLKYSGEVILEKAYIDGVDKESFNEAKAFLEVSLQSLSKSEEHFNLLDLLNNHSDYLYAHALGVSLYCVLVAQKMGLESSSVMSRLSMAGLFHDIGKKEVDRAILEKPRHMLSAEECRLIEGHVSRGQDILLAVRNVPSEVIQIVFEHHEDLKGMGFPIRKTKNEQHPLSRILQAVNKFIELTIETPLQKPMPAKEALSRMKMVYDDRLDYQVMSALDSLFK